MQLKSVLIAAGALILAACQHAGAESPVQTQAAADEGSEGLALAQAACAGCHSVEAYGLSPNPAAPEWPVIANTQGLTRETLTHWLTQAHNYPEQMDFYLEEDEVELLVDYMLTLQRDDYHPPY
ncbi:c-type cytochrome [Aurantiacibacter sp. D1-12]|uniref:c-type cytochrome n=1 Tax=Aurantiacibacter sp. D1-12 TaxID=2993658 RepID=UPI00237CE7EB|nr:c-type cytochrome [Aurantiacibacter sp. D1-12]MDE1466972.1 c-type cytochrome [Aurantiacibacter sp. D1-12]